MRARGVTVVAALVAALVAPAHAARPPEVAGVTYLFGVGSVSIDVTVPKGVSLVATPPAGRVVRGFAKILTDDASWGAVGIFARGGPSFGGKRFNAVQVHLGEPDHCPPPTAPTVPPPAECDEVVEHTLVNAPAPTVAGGTLRYALAPGTYQIVVSGPPGEFVHAELRFAGARGVRGLAPTRRATTHFARTRAEDLAFVHARDSWSHRFTGNGLGVLGLWHTAAGDEPGQFTYTECVTPGAAGPLNPDDCLPLGATGQTPPDAVGRKPAFFAGSVGGFTLESWGAGTFQTPVLPAGTYVNTFRLTRGGRGPAVGAFVWWVQADALR